MALYNLDKDYEEKIASILQRLSDDEYKVKAIGLLFVTEDMNVICSYENAEIPDLMLMASYLQMIAQSKYYTKNRETFEEDEDLDYQSDIGLTD